MDVARKKIVDALIFASDNPISLNKIMEIAEISSKQEAEEIVNHLIEEYEHLDRSFHIVKIAGGYQFVTREKFAKWISLFYKGRRKSRLSAAALETLAVVAYRQPVTRPEIDRIRGVDSFGVIQNLLERNLIKISGKSKTPGRPLIYKTTDELLRYLGLDSLKDLPKIEEVISKDKESNNNEIEQVSGESGSSFAEEK